MSSRRGPVAVVVGGGIGGLATGLALEQAGWQVAVRERASRIDRGGAGLVLGPNALRCLAALGVDDVVRARSTPLAGSVVRRPDDRALARVSSDDRVLERPLGVVRSDLVNALADALGPETLRLGDEVADLAGTVADADLVVGADGLRSVVRGSFGVDVQPEYRGYTVWRALVPVSITAPGGSPQLSETWGAGQRFGIVPAGLGATYVYAAAVAPEGECGSDETAELRQRFGGWHAPIPDLVAAMESTTVLRHDIYDLPPGRTPLHLGRRVLVGDAAHGMEPNLGQGAALALEDAVVLAHALAGEPSVEAALGAYSRARTPRVVALARQSRNLGRLARLQHPATVAMRDLTMLMTPDRLGRRTTGSVTDWRPPPSTLPTLRESAG